MPYEKTDNPTLHIAILVPTAIHKARMVRAANIEGRSLNNWFCTTGWQALLPVIHRAEHSSPNPLDREDFTNETAVQYLDKHMGRWRKGHKTRKEG